MATGNHSGRVTGCTSTHSSTPSRPAQPVRPAHREHLRSSGLSDATIAAAGLRTVDEARCRELGFARGLRGLAFPYPGTRVVVDGRAQPN